MHSCLQRCSALCTGWKRSCSAEVQRWETILVVERCVDNVVVLRSSTFDDDDGGV
jgi:hypothetical protein